MKKIRKAYLLLLIVTLLFVSIGILSSCGDDECKHTWDEGTTVDATCYQQGAIAYTCTKCGKIRSEIIPAKGHSFTNYVDNGDATCALEGTKTALCDNGCGATDTKPTEKRHNYGAEWESTADGHFHVCATCNGVDSVIAHIPDADGLVCTICDYVIHAHTPIKVDATGATCTENGNIEYWRCSVCELNFADEACEQKITNTVTEPLNHSPSHIPANDATCTEAGNVECWYCARCDKYFGEATCENILSDADRIIPTVSHNYNVQDKNSTQHWYKCSCGDVNTESYENHVSAGPATLTNPEVCSSCGYVIAPALDHVHTPTYYAAKAATCTEGGNIAFYFCDGCDGFFSDAECENELSENDLFIEALGHAETHVLAKEPNCTENGNVEHWYCENCEKYFSDEALTTEISANVAIRPATHNEVLWTGAVSPTCTKEGNSEFWHCRSCDKYFSDRALKNEISLSDTVIGNVGHSVTYVARVEATCTTTGVREHYLCANCKKSYTTVDCSVELAPADRVIDAPGHIAEELPHETVASTCTQNGYLIFKCKNCEYTFRNGTLPLAECSWTLVNEVEATCQSTGSMHYECEVCDNEKTVTVAKADHDYGEAETVAPTCVADGYTRFVCQTEGCGYSYRTDTVAKLGHEYVIDEEASIEPTCTEDGVEVTVCENGCDFRFEETISATGHTTNPTCETDSKCEHCDFVAAKTEHNYKISELKTPTCTEDGYIKYTCQNAGCEHPTKTETPEDYAKLGHRAPDNAKWTEVTKPAEDGVACHVYVERSTKCRDCDHVIVTTGDEHFEHDEITVIVSDATCNTPGVIKYVCKNCNAETRGEYSTETFENKDAHTWDEGVDSGNGTIVYTCGCGETKSTVSAKTEQSATIDAGTVADATDVELEHATFVPDENVKGSLSGNVTFGAEEKDVASLGLPKNVLDEISGSQVYDFTLKVDGSDVGTLNGVMTVRVPYRLDEGEDINNIVVFYINYGPDYENNPDDITIEKYDARYVVINGQGYAEFETDHFSQYTVTKMTPEQRCNHYGHNFTDDIIVPKTCLTDGYIMRICTRCGHIETETPDYLVCTGHNWAENEETKVIRTCETDGYVKITCGDCRISYEIREAATGHDWIKDAENSIAATCTSHGVNKYVCQNNECGKEKTETTPQKPHSYTKTVIEPTCTEDGYTSEYCSSCQTTKITNRTEALGHSFIDEAHEPTCIENGYTSHVCERCDEEFDTAGAERNEDLHKWNVESASCTTDKFCEYCGTILERAIGHEFASNGICVRKDCSHKCEHDYKLLKAVDASCVKPAHEIHQCSICLNTKEMNYTGDKTAHDMPDGICKVCGITSGNHYLSMIETWKNVDGFAIKLSDFSLSIEEYVADKAAWYVNIEAATLDIAELMLYIDENGKLAGAFNGTVTVKIYTFGEESYVYGASGAIENGYVYLELLDGYDDVSELNESFMVISLDSAMSSALSSMGGIGENSMVGIVLDWASEELLPILEDFKNNNIEELDVITKNIVNMVLREELTENGFIYTLDEAKLRALCNSLMTMPLSEVIDLYFGYGSYDKLAELIPTILDAKVPEIPELLASFGFDTDELITAINNLVRTFGNQSFDISTFLTDPAYAEVTVGMLALGESDGMISEMIEAFREAPLPYLFAPPEAIESVKKMIDDAIDEIVKILDFSYETNTAGRVTSIYLGVNAFTMMMGSDYVNGELMYGERMTISFKIEFTPNGKINLNTNAIITKINENVVIPEVEAGTDYDYYFEYDKFEGEMPSTITFGEKHFAVVASMKGIAQRVYSDYTNPIVVTTSQICGDEYLCSVAFSKVFETMEIDMYMVLSGEKIAYIFESKTTEEMIGVDILDETTVRVFYTDGSEKFLTTRNSDTEYAVFEAVFASVSESWYESSYSFQMSPDLYISYNSTSGDYEFVDGSYTPHSLVLNEENSIVRTECETTSVYVYECEHCDFTTKRYETNTHDISERFELHEGATSCEDGLDLHHYCTKCNETTQVYENYFSSHVCLTTQVWNADNNTLTLVTKCLCGEMRIGDVVYKFTGDGEFNIADFKTGFGDANILTFVPSADGTFEFYSTGTNISLADKDFNLVLPNGDFVYTDTSNKNENHIAKPENKDCKHDDRDKDGYCDYCGDELGYFETEDGESNLPMACRKAYALKAGEVYYIFIEDRIHFENEITVDASIRESVEISLDTYGCTCGQSMTVTDNFEKKTVTLPEHSAGCALSHAEETRKISEDCKRYEILKITFALNGEVVGEYEAYRFFLGYDEHELRHNYTSKVVDELDQYGNLVSVRTEKSQQACAVCGTVISEQVYITATDKKLDFTRYTKQERYYFNTNSGTLEIDYETGTVYDKITYADGGSEYKEIENYTYHYKNGAKDGSKTEYIYNPQSRCTYTEKTTTTRGEVNTNVYSSHIETDKSLPGESGTELVEVDGVIYSLVTEATETYCSECNVSISKTISKTYTSEDGSYVRVETEYYEQYANSATDYGYALAEKNVKEFGFVFSAGKPHRYTISSADYYYEKGELYSYEKQVYNYRGGYCEYTVTRYSPEYPDGQTNDWEVVYSHIAAEHVYTLQEGSTSCEDGFVCYYTCAGCGLYEYQYEDPWGDHSWHSVSTVYDLKEHGSTCGGTVTLETCLCGERKSVHINCECDLDDMGDGKYECSVTDPWCDFEYLYVKEQTIDENCNVILDEYYVFGTGDDALKIVIAEGATGEVAHNMTTPENGREYTEGEYTVTVMGGQEYCANCGAKGSGHEYFTYKIGQDTYKTIDVYYDDFGRPTNKFIYEYVRFDNPNSEGDYTIVASLTRYEEYDDGELYYWDQTKYNYDGCPNSYTETYTNSLGSNTTSDPTEHERYEMSLVETIQFPSCTQPMIGLYRCNWCGYEKCFSDSVNGHSMWENSELGCYVCTSCGLQSDKLAMGDIILEELTKSYGNGENIVIGYYNTALTYNFLVNVSLFIDGDEDTLITYMPGSENILDTRIYVSISELVSALADFNEENGTAFSLCEERIRISLVPIGDGDFDYAITLDPHILKATVKTSENDIWLQEHTFDCVLCDYSETVNETHTVSDSFYYEDENGINHTVQTHYCYHCGHLFRTDYYEINTVCTSTTYTDCYLYENGEFVFKYTEKNSYSYHSTEWTEKADGNTYTVSDVCCNCGDLVNGLIVNVTLDDGVSLSLAGNDEMYNILFEISVSESGRYNLYTDNFVSETDNSLFITVYDDSFTTIDGQVGNIDGINAQSSIYLDADVAYYVRISTWNYDYEAISTFDFIVEKTV